MFRWILLFLLFTPFLSIGQAFDFNTNCQKAYRHILCFQLDQGRALLQKEREANPNNVIVPFIDNYADFLELFIGEDPYLLDKGLDRKDERLDAISDTKDKDSPYYTYAPAEIHMQWAFIHLKLGQYFKGALSLYKSNQLLMETKEKHPEFTAVNKTLGLIHAIMGTVPSQYKWMVNLVGFEGNIGLGTKEMESVMLDSTSLFQEEASIFYVFALLYLQNDKQGAWENASQFYQKYPDNLVLRFAAAQVATQKGDTKEALNILQGYPKSKYNSFPYLDLMIGNALMRQLSDEAKPYFMSYTENYKGNQYIKEAYMKLAWISALQNDKNNYQYFCQLGISKGSLESESDQFALYHCQKEEMPDTNLLKARLLFDGGFYDKSMTALLNCPKTKSEEYIYRKARIYEAKNEKELAIDTYQELLVKEDFEHPLFQAKTYLQVGLIYESQKDYQLANFYFDKLLKMKDFIYEKSLHQKAQTAKNRIKTSKT